MCWAFFDLKHEMEINKSSIKIDINTEARESEWTNPSHF